MSENQEQHAPSTVPKQFEPYIELFQKVEDRLIAQVEIVDELEVRLTLLEADRDAVYDRLRDLHALENTFTEKLNEAENPQSGAAVVDQEPFETCARLAAVRNRLATREKAAEIFGSVIARTERALSDARMRGAELRREMEEQCEVLGCAVTVDDVLAVSSTASSDAAIAKFGSAQTDEGATLSRVLEKLDSLLSRVEALEVAAEASDFDLERLIRSRTNALRDLIGAISGWQFNLIFRNEYKELHLTREGIPIDLSLFRRS